MDSYSRSSGECLEFSDAEIRNELSRLGYNDIDPSHFEEFKRDLITLVQAERSSSFSSENSTTQYPHRSHYKSKAYDHTELYKPPVHTKERLAQVSLHEKENTDSISRPYLSAHERFPLRDTPSNTSAYATVRCSPVKASRHYATSAASQSLPRPRGAGDYYRPADQSHERPHSAGEYRKYSNVCDDGVSLEHRHLDNYWYGEAGKEGATSNYYTAAAPYRDDVAAHASESHDYTTASDFSQHPKDDTLADTLADTLHDKLNLSRASQSSVVKRKVSRRRSDGTSHVYEESYLQEGQDDSAEGSDGDSVTTEISEPVKPSYINSVLTAALSSYPFTGDNDTNRPSSRTRLPSTRYDKSVDPVRSSVIWPEAKPVSCRNMVKTDPVSRYQQYQQEWAKSKVPEEKKHKDLRWAVREQMLYKDIIYEKPQKKFVPNKYVVPTDKKRKDLRWRIRTDMAAGIMPGSS